MSAQPYSRADRNRVRRGREDDRPRNPKARGAWAHSVMRRRHPGERYHSVTEFYKLIYDERDIARAAMRRHPLLRRIARAA